MVTDEPFQFFFFFRPICSSLMKSLVKLKRFYPKPVIVTRICIKTLEQETSCSWISPHLWSNGLEIYEVSDHEIEKFFQERQDFFIFEYSVELGWVTILILVFTFLLHILKCQPSFLKIIIDILQKEDTFSQLLVPGDPYELNHGDNGLICHHCFVKDSLFLEPAFKVYYL